MLGKLETLICRKQSLSTYRKDNCNQTQGLGLRSTALFRGPISLRKTLIRPILKPLWLHDNMNMGPEKGHIPSILS